MKRCFVPYLSKPISLPMSAERLRAEAAALAAHEMDHPVARRRAQQIALLGTVREHHRIQQEIEAQRIVETRAALALQGLETEVVMHQGRRFVAVKQPDPNRVAVIDATAANRLPTGPTN